MPTRHLAQLTTFMTPVAPKCRGHPRALGHARLEGVAVAKTTRQRSRRQYAALPLSWDEDGQRLVMLVTSRETRRWIIPKGWAEKNLAPHEVAAKEAREEAGLEGEIGREPVATYRYVK